MIIATKPRRYPFRIHPRDSDANAYLAWRFGNLPEPLSDAELAKKKAPLINKRTATSLKRLSKLNADQTAAKSNQYLATIKRRRKAFIAAATVKNLSRDIMVAANVEPDVIEQVIAAQAKRPSSPVTNATQEQVARGSKYCYGNYWR